MGEQFALVQPYRAEGELVWPVRKRSKCGTMEVLTPGEVDFESDAVKMVLGFACEHLGPEAHGLGKMVGEFRKVARREANEARL